MAEQKALGFDELRSQIDEINRKMGYGESSLAASPTAYTEGVRGSGSDIAKEIELRKLKRQKDALESQLLQKKWYGEGKAPEEVGGKRKEGLLESAIHTLSAPLYGVVGGVEALTGKGTAPGWRNIAKNIEERGTFGDLLKKEGIHGGIAAPLGFFLDIMFDPINWATAGTGALIPRIGVGVAKAGLKGGLKGAESGLLQKAATISRIVSPKGGKKTAEVVSKDIVGEVPGEVGASVAKQVKKAVGEGYEAAVEAKTSGIRSLQERALRSSEEYDKLIGRELEKVLDERKLINAGEVVKGLVEKLPYGESIWRAFEYAPGEWFKRQLLRDKIEELYRAEGKYVAPHFDEKTGKMVKVSEEDIKSAQQAAVSGKVKDVMSKIPGAERLENYPVDELIKRKREAEEAVRAKMSIMRDPDALSRTSRMLEEAGIEFEHRDLVKVLNEIAEKESRITRAKEKARALEELTGEKQKVLLEEAPTGIKWYDELKKSVKSLRAFNGTPYAERILDVYGAAIGMFKAAKVSLLSPSAMMNAVAGNLVMAQMGGLNILRPGLLRAVNDAFWFLNGKGSAKFLRDYIDINPELRPYFASHVNTFGGVMGMRPDDFMTHTNREMLIKIAKEQGFADEMTEEFVNETLKRAENATRISPLERTIKSREKGETITEAATFTAQELGSNQSYLRFKNWAAENAATNPVAKTLNFMMTKPVSVYERVDQAWRLGGFLHMVNNGLEKDEIIKLSRFIPIHSKDLAEKIPEMGRYVYKLEKDKALEAVNMLYLNYSAMPGAIKVLREIPLFGVPFASFGYGMGLKTAETLLYNPAMFNKVNFLISEITGEQTPLEKEAMAKGFYENLNQYGMLKSPFFRENPTYINIANMLPYLTLNLFEESGRKYQDRFPDKMAQTIESMPLLKDPVGQLIFDYFIQPMILRDQVQQTQFGSPLYPSEATATEKAGYAARSLAEAFVPSGVGAATGLAAGYLGLPEGAIEYAPSYRFRQLARGIRGEDIFGAQRIEDPLARTWKGISATLGVPQTQMNLDFLAKEFSKKKKK